MADVKQIIEDLRKWNAWDKPLEAGFTRDPYLEQLKGMVAMPEVTALVGIRRCGKSFTAYQLLNFISQNLTTPQNTLLINFEDPALGSNLNAEDLIQIFESYLQVKRPQGKIYLFLDEVQNVKDWQKFVFTLHDSAKADIKIVVTGSNSSLLDSEISTLLSGRYVHKRIYPLSFKEFLQFKKVDAITQQRSYLFSMLFDYMEYGGFPRVVLEESAEGKNLLLAEYFNSIVERDIIYHNNIRKKVEIKNLAQLIMSNPSQLFSYSKTGKVIGMSAKDISKNVGYFEDAYLAGLSKKYDTSVKKQILNPKKIYLADMGLCAAVGFRFTHNYGHYLENVVYNHFLAKGMEIYYYTNGGEVDMVCKEGINIKYLINVCYDLTPDNFVRETKSLTDTPSKGAQKMVVYWNMDRSLKPVDGIEFVNILDLLLATL